ncbi:MAG: hypothetical protein LW824_20155 [Algoriphagus sp.]|nr:hypothetical protein [Algoriphagus sp.]MCE2779883.1 hypothetical protein [Algoriphagus sp.]
MKNPEEELAEIKSMMERSTRFLSLSGLSGVLAGIYALTAAGLTWYWIYFPNSSWGAGAAPLSFRELLNRLLFLGLVTLVAAVSTAYFLSKKKGTTATQPFWSPASKRFLLALFLPVALGGFFCFALLHESTFELIPAAMLLFYGIGLVQSAQFTLGEIKNLGYTQLALGLIAAFFPDYGLLCWAMGFGVFHLIYGALMYCRHER